MDSLQGTKLSPSLYVFATDPAFVRSSHSPFKAVPGASGLRLSRPASAANGGVFIYSRFTFGGPFRLTVDNTGWEFGLDEMQRQALASASLVSRADRISSH